MIENVEKSVQRLEDLKSYRRKYEDATEKLATMNERLKLLENVSQLAIMVESIEKEVLLSNGSARRTASCFACKIESRASIERCSIIRA